VGILDNPVISAILIHTVLLGIKFSVDKQSPFKEGIMSETGTFVWYDLMTRDIEGSIKFYTELLGWDIEDYNMGDQGVYRMIKNGQKFLGGFAPHQGPEEVPPYWIGYVNVADVDGSAAKALELGGKHLVPPTDIPEVGRFAMLMDPHGAQFALYKSKSPDDGEASQPGPGDFCWNEVMSTDPEVLKSFYTGLFGWSVTESPMGDQGSYYIFKIGDKETAGLMKVPTDCPAPPSWMTYIFVSDLEGSTKKAEELGAKVLQPVTPIPDIGRFTVIQDPQGAVLGLFSA